MNPEDQGAGPAPTTPVRPSSYDGIYPRCVWCNGENWAIAVIAYSAGEIPCAAAGGCGQYLPDHYEHFVREQR